MGYLGILVCYTQSHILSTEGGSIGFSAMKGFLGFRA